MSPLLAQSGHAARPLQCVGVVVIWRMFAIAPDFVVPALRPPKTRKIPDMTTRANGSHGEPRFVRFKEATSGHRYC